MHAELVCEVTKRETSRVSEERGEEGGWREGGGGGFMTDRHKVLWGMSNGPTGAGKPTQRQLRVKDDKNI